MMGKITLTAFIAALFALSILINPKQAQTATDPYKIISSENDFNDVMNQAKQVLLSGFGISLKYPVSGFLVTGKKLDEIYAGEYRGAETGLYLYRNGRHEVFIMKDMSFDNCIGTTSHELVHAWQLENCPVNQDRIVKEGFANWVEYKVYQKMGAFTFARSMIEQADPVYGVGMKKMLEWEDKWGDFGLVQKIRSIKTLSGN